ncbi:PAQR family membrane homeostasis protein TrhA [Aquibacillus albus]|uniref:Hemolysin III n=1 Tax=Aquibacillus albus TaxID=1168171 RepID=A0ABS2N5C8_9BACI|nr:hemolysin III family protein [Aquibacillus albus]MBM7573340.1 hemolysin III [Aquibacillus albus]
MSKHTCTKQEEVVNAITHGIGAILSIVAIAVLIKEANTNANFWQFLSVTVYGITMFMMFMSSTIMHSLPEGKTRDFFHMLDHSSIFLFIAGTYTPIALFLIEGSFGWMILTFVWTVACLGIIFKIIFLKRYMVLTTLIYISFGWFIVFAWEPITSEMASQGILLLVYGGLSYSIGTVFFLWKSLPYSHAIWHLFVLVGSALHFLTVLNYVIQV